MIEDDVYKEIKQRDAQPDPLSDENVRQSLTAIVYQLFEVQEKLFKDVKTFSTASHDVVDTCKTFKTAVKDFSMLTPELKRQIQEMVYKSVRDTIKSQEETIGKDLVTKVAGETQSIINSLDRSMQTTRWTLDQYVQEQQYSRWVYVATGIFAGLVISLGAFFFMKANPTSLMNEKDYGLYKNGVLLSKAWDGLSEKEQNRIYDLADEWNKKNG